MNALFIGPYRQKDGWGSATRDYIKAIKTQIDHLKTQPIYYVNNTVEDLDNSIHECEKKSFPKYDMVFQQCLPQSFTVNSYVKKNIGMTMLETNDISKSVSIPIINGLDEICVPSEQEAKCLKTSGVNIPIKVISQPIDVEYYKKNKDHKIDMDSTILDNSFNFYTIGEMVERKNFFDLIMAFNLAFNHTDNVHLIIKTNEPANDVRKKINEWKKHLRIHKQYKQEIIISDRLSDLDLIGLHNYCDCFVSSSYGESFCRPAAEALILGKTPIVTDNTGMTDFVNKENGFVVQSKKTPVVVSQSTLSPAFDMYNAYEHWYQPNVYRLSEAMQNVYNMYKKNKKEYLSKQELGINSIDQFSYENIGKKICS